MVVVFIVVVVVVITDEKLEVFFETDVWDVEMVVIR